MGLGLMQIVSQRMALFGCAVLAGSLAQLGPATALTMEEAKVQCRPSVQPQMQACMQRLGGVNPGNRDQCRESAAVHAAGRACVIKLMDAANGRANVAIAVGKKKEEVVPIGNALPAGFLPPPRTIADIAAILDAEKPDAGMIASLKRDAAAEPGAGVDLARFYYDRGVARSLLGRFIEAAADGEKAIGFESRSSDEMFLHRMQMFVGLQKQLAGDMKATIATYQQVVRESGSPKMSAWQIAAYQQMLQVYVQAGDVSQADDFLRRSLAILTTARTSGIPQWREAYNIKGRSWEGAYESSRGLVLESRGNYRDAEQAYLKAADYRTASLEDIVKPRYTSPPPRAQVIQSIDLDRLNAARTKAKQGRLAEAEVDMRAVLLSRLRAEGKYHPLVPKFIVGLASILLDEGRYEEAEKLTRVALDIQRTIGIADDAQSVAQTLSLLGAELVFQRKNSEASEVYGQLDRAIAKWEPSRRDILLQNGSRIAALLASGQTTEAIASAEALVRRQSLRLGEKNFDTAAARGTLAIGYMKAGRVADAIREFRAAIPLLMAASRENADDDDTSVNAGRSQQLQAIIEKYIELQAKNGGVPEAVETFTLADSIRGRSVDAALAASSARSSVKDPALVDVIRREQDLSKKINAQLGSLNNALSSEVRDDKVIRATNAAIDKLRSERDRTRAELNTKFPAYADLVSPKAPSVDQIKSTLADGEALLSFYFGREASFVWAVPKDGNIAFAAIPATSGEIESKVNKLREALEPQAPMVSDIPAFDIALGYELYSLLLKPVEAGWRSSKNLMIVTNGALGLLPLSLLPTEAVELKDGETLFSGYRNVPWLARTHAVTMVPSVAALRTLRALPPGNTKRKELMAFGDPLFSKDQEKEAKQAMQVASTNPAVPPVSDASANVTRGFPLKRRNAPQLEGVDSAELAMLPRLPDTADELKSIALALKADPTEVLNLGKDANEQKVRTMDLSGFKVLAFATHGLVPGELNGLTQPALALSSPEVEGSAGDGLLTMEDILALKLDADWVVLSACNTGAGRGAGAEAASGLGRAFFYAGTRALLVTNWSVHSQSAKELVTDLFKRQADDPKITRGEALRQAMMALVDGKGFIGESGNTEFAYAHPLFWAPYTIIGDGGKR